MKTLAEVDAKCSFCGKDELVELDDCSPEDIEFFMEAKVKNTPFMCNSCVTWQGTPLEPKFSLVGGIKEVRVELEGSSRPQKSCNCGGPEDHVPGGIHCRSTS